MTQPFTAPSHHEILVLLVQISVLLFTARILGEVAQRFGQPSVLGEILAGIILGPSLLSGLSPLINEWMIPHTPVQGYLLEVISLIGALFLLLITGLEIDLSLMKRQARTAVSLSIGGITVSFASGFILGQALPDSLLAHPDQRLVFALFMAIALAISALPVIAKVLIDLKLTRRDVGQTIIAAAMIDDSIGWILLSVVIGIASGGAVSVGGILQSVGSVLALIVLSFTLGRFLVKRGLDYTQNRIISRDKIVSLVVIFMFAWAALSQALGVEALLGAFLIGIVFGQMPGLSADAVHRLESITFGIFAPLFFAVAGLKVNVLNLLEPRLLVIALLVLVVATLCKIVGVYAGARLIGKRDHWTALFFGSGLNARGSMGIIIGNIGLSLGILSQDTFSMIVLMAVATSLMAPGLLRWTLSHIQAEDQELERLRNEELNRDNMIANVHRVLLPVRLRADHRGGPAQTIEARILERIGAKTDLSLMLFNVAHNSDSAASAEYLNQLGQLFSKQEVAKKVVNANGKDAGDFILDEARKDYDLLVLGASEGRTGSDTLFTPLVDYVMRLAPCPTLLVHGPRIPEQWTPRRILVPTNGTRAARRAAEVAFALSSSSDEAVTIMQVVEEAQRSEFYDPTNRLVERQLAIAHQIVDELRVRGEALNVPTSTEVRVGREPEAEILAFAQHHTDLIVLGTSVRAGSDRLYLGPRVERILKSASCPVIVVNSD